MRPPIDKLIKAEFATDDSAVEARREIQVVAGQYGPYLVASEIQEYVTSRRGVSDSGEKVHRGRGFELAGELYYQNLLREIHLIEKEGRRLGPSVFEQFCTELLECFFSGDNVRRGVGFPILLIEELVERATASPRSEALYLSLAERAMDATIEFAQRRFEADLHERQRALRLHRKGDTPLPQAFNPCSVMDQDLVSNLTEMRDQFAVIKSSFNYASGQPLPDPATERSPQEVAEYIYTLGKSASTVGNLGIAGVLKECLARLLVPVDRGRAVTFARAAAVDFMTQGDNDFRFHLAELGLKRYSRARKLFKWSGDTKTALAVKSKIKELKKIHDPTPIVAGET